MFIVLNVLQASIPNDEEVPMEVDEDPDMDIDVDDTLRHAGPSTFTRQLVGEPISEESQDAFFVESMLAATDPSVSEGRQATPETPELMVCASSVPLDPVSDSCSRTMHRAPLSRRVLVGTRVAPHVTAPQHQRALCSNTGTRRSYRSPALSPYDKIAG